MIELSTIFNLEEDRIREEIIKRGARKVIIQLPEGLRSEAYRLALIVENAGALPIFSADPCYGACDLALSESCLLSADLLIHFGHSEVERFNRQADIPVVYVEARANVSVKEAVEDALYHLDDWREIGLVTTVQHIHSLKEAKDILEEHGKRVYIGNERGLKYPGQVLGCDYSNAKSISSAVEAFLFIGSGLFHAVGLYLATMKPTIAADPFEKKAYGVEDKARILIKKRWMDVCEAARARKWGVILGLKSGQLNPEAALRIKRELETHGRRVILLALREVTPEVIRSFPEIEAYVNTACPRISLYESTAFSKPILNPREVYVALGRINWEDYLRNGIL